MAVQRNNIEIFDKNMLCQVNLGVFDGQFNDTTQIVFTVIDVQNTPPIFQGQNLMIFLGSFFSGRTTKGARKKIAFIADASAKGGGVDPPQL